MADVDKVSFGDLNGWLKLGVVGGILYVVMFVLSFLAGFFIGLTA